MNDNECPICYEPFEKYGKCTMPCKHNFCFKCIMIHFKTNNKCALCRHELMPKNCRNQILNDYKNQNKKNNQDNIISVDLSSRRNIRNLLIMIEERLNISNR